MRILIIVVVCLAVIAIAWWCLSTRPGYRGAIGFKNQSARDIDAIQLTGFSRSVDGRSLNRGEHSFNYLGRQDLPREVKLTWRFTGDQADRSATVSLAGVPPDFKDGEIFFVISGDGIWSVQHAAELQLEKLQRGE